MENYDKIIEFAPYIIVVILFFWQNNVFVRPEKMEEMHREILNEVDSKIDKKIGEKYVEMNAYKEFQHHIYSKLDEVNISLNDIKSVIMRRGDDE